MNRRRFLQKLGFGAGSALAMMAMDPLNVMAAAKPGSMRYDADENKMTYRRRMLTSWWTMPSLTA